MDLAVVRFRGGSRPAYAGWADICKARHGEDEETCRPLVRNKIEEMELMALSGCVDSREGDGLSCLAMREWGKGWCSWDSRVWFTTL